MRYKVLVIVLFFFSLSYSQGGKMREKIKAQKIAFITNQLDLSTTEAQAFWPVFNAYESEVDDIKSGELRSIRIALRSSDILSDTEAEELLNRLVGVENELHQLKLKLINDLKGVLPPQKILKLKVADDEFNKQLLERLREMRQKRANGN